ncbi:MAG: GNAT family N-acetyltransferase [Candidatus Poribacteria bacterium]|nr:GNAT family N-acetyltransferase [Candidatus Poribacteria bacterium]
MEILQYTPDLLTPLTHFYNRLVADVPHCYPVREQELADALSGAICQTDNDDDLEAETVFVAMQNGTVQAFIHVGYYQDENEENEKENTGVIRFFGYERGARFAGQTVLKKAEEFLNTFNVTRITAFSSYEYRFYSLEYANLSNALDHVHALLGFNRYHPEQNWIVLDWENYDVTSMSPPIPITITVDWKEGRGKLPNCTVTIHRDGEKVGQCESVSGGEYSSHADAQDWVYTEWLGVEDDFQGQGFGKYLLFYSLHEMQKVGYRHASISTSWDNSRALLFYSNCGYRAADCTHVFEKVLSEVAG